MTMLLVLADYADANRTLRAGLRIDSKLLPIAEMVESGLAAIPIAGSMEQAVEAYLRARGTEGSASAPHGDLVALLLASGNLGGSGLTYVLSQTGPAAPAHNVFTDWVELVQAISTLPKGAAPQITIDGAFSVPTADMPVGGWDMKFAFLRSPTTATGSSGALTIPDGAQLLDVAAIGNGLAVIVAPTTPGTPPFTFSSPVGGIPRVLLIGLGGALWNYGSEPAIVTPGAGPASQTYTVLGIFGASFGANAPSTAPLINVRSHDIVIAVQYLCGVVGKLEDGWLVGDLTSNLIKQGNIDAGRPAIPGFLGTVIFDAQGADPMNLPYAEVVPGTFVAPPPATQKEFNDRIAAAVSALVGGPIP